MASRSRSLAVTMWLVGLQLLLSLGWPVEGRSQAPVAPAAGELQITPATVRLVGRAARHRLLVMKPEGESHRDVTRLATYQPRQPGIVAVDERGELRPLGDGQLTVGVEFEGWRGDVQVRVERSGEWLPVSFELDVQPVLAARGCNAGACHGKARGQNGFQLSLLGFDSDFDHDSLTRHARGRRVFPASPERSLLLQKACGGVPHGGGQRIEPGGADYETLRRWIANGTPRRLPGEPTLERIVVTPAARSLQPQEPQQLLVVAFYSDGSSRDVTDRSTFQSNEAAIVGVDSSGLVTAGPLPGEATIMARYQGLIATTAVAIPLPGEVPDSLYAALPRRNFVDELIWNKLQALGITPSPPVDDAKLLRRLYLDIIGRLPTPDEIRAYLADGSENKREAVIDVLLHRREYADHWANKWVDLLRPNPYRVGIKAVLNYDNFIRDSFRRNQPYDQFVQDLLTAQGSTWRNGAVTLYRDRRSPDEVATLVSQLFLGIRLECAKCHHHPFERWSQEDFFSFAAHFARVGRKGTGLSPPISGGEEVFLVASQGEVRHPLTNEVLPPRPLLPLGDAKSSPRSGEDAGHVASTDDDPRRALLDWMLHPDNEYFAAVMVNRVWADIMGRGLVEPVDDLRATNPPSNEPLLRALAAEFRRQRFDLKELIRTIVSSHAYALSSLPTERNVADTRNYSRHYRQRLRAEVLSDAISDITGLRDSLQGMPPQSRANQIWTHRVDSLFLDTFGRPDPNQDPPCERTPDSTVTQALHLMNAPQLHSKITSDAGQAAQWAASKMSDAEVVELLYLTVYGRLPEAEEQQLAGRLFTEPGASRRQVVEDLMWAMINTPEFVFKD